MAVGWHEHGHSFSQGTPAPDLLATLKALIDKAGVEHSQYNFRGLHCCSLCEQGPDAPRLENSHINLFIPGEGVIFYATAGTLHYMESHGYLPPSAFIEAIHHCPEYGSAAYYDALRTANHGQLIPLRSKAEEERERRDYLAERALRHARTDK